MTFLSTSWRTVPNSYWNNKMQLIKQTVRPKKINCLIEKTYIYIVCSNLTIAFRFSKKKRHIKSESRDCGDPNIPGSFLETIYPLVNPTWLVWIPTKLTTHGIEWYMFQPGWTSKFHPNKNPPLKFWGLQKRPKKSGSFVEKRRIQKSCFRILDWVKPILCTTKQVFVEVAPFSKAHSTRNSRNFFPVTLTNTKGRWQHLFCYWRKI